MYRRADSARLSMSEAGSWRKSLRRWDRTEADPSRIRGSNFGSRIAVGRGKGALTGCDVIWVVRYAKASRRWVSEREDVKDK